MWLKGMKRRETKEMARHVGLNLRKGSSKKHRIRCMTIWDLEDVQKIEGEFITGSVVLFSMKEVSVQGHHVFRRFLQQVNALARQYEYQLIRFSREYIMGIPLESHELVTDQMEEAD